MPEVAEFYKYCGLPSRFCILAKAYDSLFIYPPHKWDGNEFTVSLLSASADGTEIIVNRALAKFFASLSEVRDFDLHCPGRL